MPSSWDPMGCSLPDSSIHGILQVRILEWVTIPFSRGSSRPRNQTPVFCIAGRFFTDWAISYKPLVLWPGINPMSPALEGRFLTTGTPGKSRYVLIDRSTLSVAGACSNFVSNFFIELFVFWLLGCKSLYMVWIQVLCQIELLIFSSNLWFVCLLIFLMVSFRD